jgi:hypothetical protein
MYASLTSSTRSLTISSSEAKRYCWCSTGSKVTFVVLTSISKTSFNHVIGFLSGLPSSNVSSATFLRTRIAVKPVSSLSSRTAACKSVSSVSSTLPPGISCNLLGSVPSRQTHPASVGYVANTCPHVWESFLVSCTLHDQQLPILVEDDYASTEHVVLGMLLKVDLLIDCIFLQSWLVAEHDCLLFCNCKCNAWRKVVV